ncbi:MAG: hypothetical protein V4506_14285 [Bacteroidota bacterium]
MLKKLLIITLFLLMCIPAFTQINFNLGMKNYNEGKYKEAIYWLDKSLEQGMEDRYKSLTVRGLAKSKSGDFKGADEDLYEALRLNPKDKYSYYNISLSFIDQKKGDLAIRYLDTAMTLTEPQDYLYNQKALAYGLMNNYSKAIEEEKKALELGPDSYENNENMGWFYFSTRDYTNALIYYNRACSIEPTDIKGVVNRSGCFIELQMYDSAIIDMDNVLKRYPLTAEIVAKKGEVRYKQKKFNEACNNFDDLKKMNDSLWTIYINKYCNNKDVINYHPSGKIEQKSTYKNGLKNGPYTTWYESGKVQLESNCKNGKFNGKFTLYFENGNINKTGNMVEDKPEGLCTEYYESGKIKTKANLTDGEDNGDFASYYENGNIHIKGTFVMGKKEGIFTENYENGSLKAEYYYKNGLEDGEYKLYHPNGKLQQQGTLLYGKEYDTPKKWDENGTPLAN